MLKDADIVYLQKRIQELEEKVDHLRFSRRVLMNLIEKIEREKGGSVDRLEKENRKLQKSNFKFAKSLLRKNFEIMELESRINGNNQP